MANRAVPPVVGNFNDIRLQFPQQISLSNGIKAWIVGHGEDEICRLSWFVPGGKFNEHKPLQSSLAAFTLFDGSKSYTSQQVAEAIDFYGVWCHGRAYDYMTKVEMMSLNDVLADIMPYYVEGMVEPAFPDDVVSHKRSLIAGNLENMMQKVDFLASKEMAVLYYGKDHPLARQAQPGEVDRLLPGDLVAFHRDCCLRYLGQSRLIIAGHITDRELKIIDDGIGRLPVDAMAQPHTSWPVVHDPRLTSFVDKPGAVQSAICMTLDAVQRTHPDYLKLRLLVIVLGGYFGSRLMQSIREEKGYTYGISAMLLGRADEAHIQISTECATAYTSRVINEIKVELKKLRDFPIDVNELDGAKQYVLSDLAKTLDTPLSIADYVENTIINGMYPEYFNNQVAEVQAATPAELQVLACRYFNLDRLRVVVAGDRAQIGDINM